MTVVSRSLISDEASVSENVFPLGLTPAIVTLRNGAQLRVVSGGAPVMSLKFDEAASRLSLLDGPGDPKRALPALSAATEAALGWSPAAAQFVLDLGNRPQLIAHLLKHGLMEARGSEFVVEPGLVMQRPDNWLADADRPPLPLHYVMTDGKRHPRRPVKPEGVVYARFIPWLSQTISFRALDREADLPLFHRWMNDPRVAAFWDEDGDLDKHRAYIARLQADPHMLPLIGCFDDVPFSYFEIYWAKENRIAPFYDAGDYDRGWHVVVGEDAYRGRQFISAWLPSLMHYMFLDDCRTQRIVGEPAAAHVQQLRNLERSGFATIKNFDFPHKRATLVMLLRERFFGDRLWLPAATEAAVRA